MAQATVSFAVLGSLEVRVGERRLRLGGSVLPRVLTTLLLSPGQMLPVARLVEAVWGENPPSTAAHQVRKAIGDLRQRIPGGSAVIVTDGPGYRADIPPGELDISLFSLRLQRAREALGARMTAEAAEQLRTALDLWRGPAPDAESSGPLIAAGYAVLEERRLAAVGQLVDLRLDLGEHQELVGDLMELVAKHPLRESFRGQLMLALYRSGRQAEALGEYTALREILVEELGVDPGRQLGSLYEAILHGRPELQAAPRTAGHENPSGPEPVAPDEYTAPCTLPHDLTGYAGRERELELLLGTADDTRRLRIVAVDGMGGSGKTSLVVRAAHRLADAYPDGRLHTDLRGFSPSQEPRDPGIVIAALLRTLGVPDERIPEDLDGRVALWRSTLSGRRVLLVLDNAADAAQVRPLLPASAGCLVLITSRSRMSELDGSESVSLDVLPPADSLALLRAALGEERARTESAEMERLAELCGHLPLALCVAAARLRSRARWTVRYLVDRLADESRRLDELRSGDRSVEATLRLSYQAMGVEHRTMLRLLAIHPGTDFDVPAAAALLGLERADAEDVLEQFLDVHLLEQYEMDRYAFHDLVRRFARRLPTEGDETAAFARLLDHGLAVTDEACRVLFPSRGADPLRGSPSAAPPAVMTPKQAAAVFDREHSTLLALVRQAVAEEGFDEQAVPLARNLVFYLDMRSYLPQYEKTAALAATAARRLNNLPALRNCLNNLSVAQWKAGRFTEGIATVAEALAIAEELDDRRDMAVSLNSLGLLNSSLGRLAAAEECLERAVELFQGSGAGRQEGYAHSNLSSVYSYLGRHQDAAAAAERAVQLSCRYGAESEGVTALTDLAIAQLSLNETAQAHATISRALSLGDERRTPEDLALAFAVASDIHQRLGDHRRSTDCAERSLELIRSEGTAIRRPAVENILGNVHGRRGSHYRALALHRDAYRHAQVIGFRVEAAHALRGLATAEAALGDAEAARVHREQADELCTRMGIPFDRYAA
ncbi:BTAD domain-containing putative transcriptional regulator [uncultured Streptomyces sp.]|uniref:AfsR/SARP family transcriptional regulator n=1 Tax=uncultured Streptomyces sp. TaxID=174707 RepID=UPI00262CDA75|nr:BTAD domain-containing putative transcriptional regulator [uncultured Streptomyces sp.]